MRHPEVSVSYFRPDGKKDGGAYVTIMGRVEAIDTDHRIIVLEDGAEIPIEEIRGLETMAVFKPLHRYGKRNPSGIAFDEIERYCGIGDIGCNKIEN